MKKSLFILATAALVFASCNNDVKIDENKTLDDANEISFQPEVKYPRRASATTIANFTTTNGFYVGAWKNSDNSSYFADTEFKKDGSTSDYRSDTKYYWPASGNLDFVGFYPNKDNTNGPLKHLAWNTFTFEPAATVASHVDYVIAATLNQAKPVSGGVGLAFKHLGSWIELKAYNSKGNANGNMKTSVQGWKIGYLHKGGVYTISSSTANGTALSATGTWNYDSYPVHSSNVPTEYKETLASAVTTTTDGACDASAEAVAIGNAMIIVPQATTKMTGSSTYNATGGYLTGAFIAVKLQITDGSNNVIADATGTTVVSDVTRDLWAIWPVNNDWADGTKYTYVIDLSQGGYKEIGTASGVLEKWLDGAEIYFSSVTVTDWANGSAAVVNP
jgi:hypothetical protein